MSKYFAKRNNGKTRSESGETARKSREKTAFFENLDKNTNEVVETLTMIGNGTRGNSRKSIHTLSNDILHKSFWPENDRSTAKLINTATDQLIKQVCNDSYMSEFKSKKVPNRRVQMTARSMPVHSNTNSTNNSNNLNNNTNLNNNNTNNKVNFNKIINKINNNKIITNKINNNKMNNNNNNTNNNHYNNNNTNSLKMKNVSQIVSLENISPLNTNVAKVRGSRIQNSGDNFNRNSLHTSGIIDEVMRISKSREPRSPYAQRPAFMNPIKQEAPNPNERPKLKSTMKRVSDCDFQKSSSGASYSNKPKDVGSKILKLVNTNVSQSEIILTSKPDESKKKDKVSCYSLKRKHAYMNLLSSMNVETVHKAPEGTSGKNGFENQNTNQMHEVLFANPSFSGDLNLKESLNTFADFLNKFQQASTKTSKSLISNGTKPKDKSLTGNENVSNVSNVGHSPSKRSKTKPPEHGPDYNFYCFQNDILANVDKLCNKTNATQEILTKVLQQNMSLAQEVADLKSKLKNTNNMVNHLNHSNKVSSSGSDLAPIPIASQNRIASRKNSLITVFTSDMNTENSSSSEKLGLQTGNIMDNLDCKHVNDNDKKNANTSDNVKNLLRTEHSIQSFSFEGTTTLEDLSITSESLSDDILESEDRDRIKLLSEQILKHFKIDEDPKIPSESQNADKTKGTDATPLMSDTNLKQECQSMEQRAKNIFGMNLDTFNELQGVKLQKMANHFCVKVLISNILKHLIAKMLLKKYILNQATQN